MTVAEQVLSSQPRIEFSDLIGSCQSDAEVCNDPYAPEFEGYPDELPAAISNFCAGDRVVHADHWQGELDSPEPFEPSDADWDDLYAARYGTGDDDDIQAAGLPVG